MNNETLASEIIQELKANSKRWFIAFIVVLALWFATIGCFLWYISLPVEEYDIDQSSGHNSSSDLRINQIGGSYYGGEDESQD